MMTRALLLLSAVLLALAVSHAAPARYNQRQDGVFNVHAKLENLLFVFAVPGNTGLLGELAQQLASRSNASPSSSLSEDHASDSTSTTVHKPGEETVNETEGYSSKITRLDGDNSNRESSLHVTEADANGAETAGSSDLRSPPASIGEGVQGEKADDVARMPKVARGFESSNSLEKSATPRHLDDVDMRKSHGPKTSRQKPIAPSRKPPLLREDTDNAATDNVAPSSSSADKNAVAMLPDEKQQELRLLGDGIENCGPGRRRDAAGVCQFDESAASLL